MVKGKKRLLKLLLALVLMVTTTIKGQVTVDKIKAVKNSPIGLYNLFLRESYGHTYENDVKNEFFNAINENFTRLKETTDTSIPTQAQKSDLGKLLINSVYGTHILNTDHISKVREMLTTYPQFAGAFRAPEPPPVIIVEEEEEEEPETVIPPIKDYIISPVEEPVTPIVERPEPIFGTNPVEEKPKPELPKPGDLLRKPSNNIELLQSILQRPHENQQIRGLYGVMQQAAGQTFDPPTKNAFAQTLVHVFNNARTVTTYLAQMLNAAKQSPLLNPEQQKYVAATMLPLLAGKAAPAAPEVGVPTAAAPKVGAPTPPWVKKGKKVKKKKKKKKKFSMKKLLKKKWAKKKIKKVKNWKKLSKKKQKKLLKKWLKKRKAKKKKKKLKKKKKKKAKGKLKGLKKKKKKKKKKKLLTTSGPPLA